MLTDEEKAAKEQRAMAATERLERGEQWLDWMYVGEWFAVVQTDILNETGANAPYGRAYTRAMGAFLKARPWTKRYDPKTRSDAIWCAENRNDIEAWRATLATNVRDRLNHPTSVRRRYEAAQRAKPADAVRPPSPFEKLKVEVVRLEEENMVLRKRAAADGSLFDLRKDPIKDIARTIADNIGPSRLAALHKELGAEIARRKAEQKQAG